VKHVAVLHHPVNERASALAAQASSEFGKRGVSSSVTSVWSDSAGHAITEADFVLCIGGDGTVLRAARLGAEHGAAILGVNMGSLGFLTELGPEEFLSRLDDIVAGKWRSEERLMVFGRAIFPGAKPVEVFGLNDVVVSRSHVARPINVELRVDEAMVAEYRCDGMIVATPTGSTGYSLSAGGPILAPAEHHLVVTPVSPHLALGRSLVLQPASTVEMHVTSEHGAVMSVDGQEDAELPSGARVQVGASEHLAIFARFSPASAFYAELAERLENQLSSTKNHRD
jgi:NAD+ kinase